MSGGPRLFLIAGEPSGDALARVLTGAAEPGGRLPLTIPASIDDTPAADPRTYPGVDGSLYYVGGAGINYQRLDGVTLAPMLSKAEGLTRWTCPSGQVIDHVRGMDPWPGAFTGRGPLVLKLFRAAPSSRPRPDDAAPGQVLAVDRAGMHVACGEGVVCVAELQVVGGKRMPAQAYAAGKPFAAGERLVDPPTPAE